MYERVIDIIGKKERQVEESYKSNQRKRKIDMKELLTI